MSNTPSRVRNYIGPMHPEGSELILAGERLDGRTAIARRFKELGNDLAAQLGGNLAPAERIMITNAAALTMLCERDAAALIEGKAFDEESYRRSVVALGGLLVKLGLAMKSRDITKGSTKAFDAHAASILDAD
jgi:hypothetical protein